MEPDELIQMLDKLRHLPAETEIVEFKEAKNNFDFSDLGEYFSALCNEANLKDKPFAWLVFGVEDKKHKIVGSYFRPQRKDLDNLKKEIADQTTSRITFIEIYEINQDNKRVLLFQIPAASKGLPVAFKGHYYGRDASSLVPLNIEEIERIRHQTLNRDWSKNIIPDATFAHLDKEAILKAREQYKKKHPKYRYMVDNATLFPEEVTMYDKWVIREALHNCVAHQDYSKCSRIIVLEYNNRLVFDNAGSFIPVSVEEAIRYDRPQRYYRNPFLVNAMVNLNMIDVIGSGIKKMFTIQRERFFPLPTYNVSDEEHTEVVILGELINDNYSRLLKKHPELSLDDVIALDKIQKKEPVSETEIQRLRDLKLIAGLGSDLQVAGNYAKISYQDNKQMILNLITQKGSATRDDIVNLIMPTLSPDIPIEKRHRKITNIVARLSKQEKVYVFYFQPEAHIDVKLKCRCKTVLSKFEN